MAASKAKQDIALIIQAGLDAAVEKLSVKRGTCLVDKCQDDAVAKGLCNAHYLRNKKGKDLDRPVRTRTKDCIDCGKPLNSKGGWMRCANHYKKARQRTIKESLVNALGGCCQSCGGVFSMAVYDFHHIGKKDDDPSWVIANSGIDKIAEELSKCILLCANCHRMEHERELG